MEVPDDFDKPVDPPRRSRGMYRRPSSWSPRFLRDLDKSLAFYEKLGFKRLRKDGGFAELAWDDHKLFLDQRAKLPPVPEFPAANMRVMVPDVDARWKLCNEMKARVVAPIGDRYYGLRDFTVADPDGYGVRFASFLGIEKEMMNRRSAKPADAKVKKATKAGRNEPLDAVLDFGTTGYGGSVAVLRLFGFPRFKSA